MTRWTAFVFAIVVSTSGLIHVMAQVSAAPQKVWTPEQRKAQAEYASYEADRATLKTKAQTALSTEMAREKAGDCPSAKSTSDWEVCLNAQTAKTQQNYDAFAGALRSMLGLHEPVWPGPPTESVAGPEGMPPTPEQEVVAFDRIELESKAYREHAGKIAFQQFQGGTLAPVFEMESQQKLLRMHMQELAFVYGEMLSNH